MMKKIAIALLTTCLTLAGSATLEAQIGLPKKPNIKTPELPGKKTESASPVSNGGSESQPAQESKPVAMPVDPKVKAAEDSLSAMGDRVGFLNSAYVNESKVIELSKKIDYKRFVEYSALVKPDGYYVKLLRRFFDETVPTEHRPAVVKYIEGLTKDAFIESEWKQDPQTEIKHLDEALAHVAGLDHIVKDPAENDALRTKYTSQRAMLQEYISSGAFDKFIAERHERYIREKTLPVAGMHDAQLEALVKKAPLPEKHGTPMKAIIESKTWFVEKNDAGIPLRKTLNAYAVTKFNGKCYVISTIISMEYAGGGSYEPATAECDDIPYERSEIHCDNVK